MSLSLPKQQWLPGGVVGSASNFPHVFITLRQENPEIFSPLGLKQPELCSIKLIGWLSISVGAFWENAKKLYKTAWKNILKHYICWETFSKSISAINFSEKLRKMGKRVFGKTEITLFPPFFFWKFFFENFLQPKSHRTSHKIFSVSANKDRF